MKIESSTRNDLEEIFRLYKEATKYQKIKFPENQWPEFSRNLVVKELEENRQFKIVIDDQLACVWAVTFSDAEIWEEKNSDPAIYLHRIATNPHFRGQNFVAIIVGWAREFARQHNKDFIRCDTCGHNRKLISHYGKAGFDFLGIKKLKDPKGLPAHYVDAEVCFFEIALEKEE
ncbi:GNAT family N-acetyltransferase [Antarcticibacterium flavum]|uniref:GNAT family N-acetyltransferase n=1 Tax=Antarcticibacterium flavum TaxID=2058175 RepID=A0A5B7X5G9_9FLAO|nr:MULTISPECIES: GNAT family N-acetyltransferase [Antarcticibacterium]MCM4159809.1 GNAT family N-acetyltransferase [Antarcticibacterium sp. W02-3]QCY70734.1 GNAT family N-acetyltransferase [Antarcticibacterium flavum]